MSNIVNDKKFHFIYKTTNLLNENFYYGMHSTSNLKDGYLGSGTRLRRSIRKYGIENFKIEILEFLTDRETLIVKEKELITDEMLQHPLCMNLKPGGEGGWSSELQLKGAKARGAKHKNRLLTDEDYLKSYLNKWNSIVTNKDTIDKRIENNLKKHGSANCWLNKKHTNETIEQMKKSHALNNGAGERNSQFGKCWIHNNEKSISIKKEQLDIYLNDGWVIGRKMKKK